VCVRILGEMYIRIVAVCICVYMSFSPKSSPMFFPTMSVLELKVLPIHFLYA